MQKNDEILWNLMGIDLVTRIPTGTIVLAFSVDVVRRTMGRAPDFDDGKFVSWGNVSESEAWALVALEHNMECREELTNGLHELLRKSSSAFYTLFPETR